MQFLVYKVGLSFYTPLVKDLLIGALTIILVYFNARFFSSNKVKLISRAFYFTIFLSFGLVFFSLISAFVNDVSLFVYFVGFRYELLNVLLLLQLIVFVKIINDQSDYILQSKLNLLQNSLLKIITVYYGILIVVWYFFQFLNYQYILHLLGYASSDSNQIVPNSCQFIDSTVPKCVYDGFFSSSNHFAAYLLPIFACFCYFLLRKIIYIRSRAVNSTSTSFNNLIPRIRSIWFRNFLYNLLIVNVSFNLIVKTGEKFAWLTIVNIVFVSIVCYLIFTQKEVRNRLDNLVKVFVLKYLTVCFIFVPIFLSLFYLPTVNEVFTSLNVPSYISKPTASKDYLDKSALYSKITVNSWQYVFYGYGFCSSGVCSKDFYTTGKESKLVTVNKSIINNFNLLETPLITKNWYWQIFLNNGIFYTLLYIVAVCWFPFEAFIKFVKLRLDNLGKIKFLNSDTENKIFNILLSLSLIGILFGNLFSNLFESSVLFNLFALSMVLFKKSE